MARLLGCLLERGLYVIACVAFVLLSLPVWLAVGLLRRRPRRGA